jgi:hypothetical protein
LYVLGRVANKERDSSREAVVGAPADQDRELVKLTSNEQQIWRDSVDAYAQGPSKKDIVFDDPFPAITKSLTQLDDAKSLDGSQIDPAVASILERAAPIYRKAWWPRHHKANQDWQKSVQKLVDLHGATLLRFITNAYKLEWPESGFPVHLSGYANWAGAYSTTGNLLVVASLSPDLAENYGLETVFHEGMHQWDSQVVAAIREQARKMNKRVPPGLSHALIFFTAGEAVKQIFPDHIPYGIKAGVWQRGMSSFQTVVEEVWGPYLKGQGTREDAFAELVKRVGVDPPKQ